MKKLFKKISNFQFTSWVISCIEALAAVTFLGFIFSYQFSGEYNERRKMYITAFDINSKYPSVEHPQILGMIFFLSAIIGIILAVVIIVKSSPFLVLKTKQVPAKSNVLLCAINGVFLLIDSILSILVLTNEESNTVGGFVASLAFGFILGIVSLFFIVPFIKTTFFVPEVQKK